MWPTKGSIKSITKIKHWNLPLIINLTIYFTKKHWNHPLISNNKYENITALSKLLYISKEAKKLYDIQIQITTAFRQPLHDIQIQIKINFIIEKEAKKHKKPHLGDDDRTTLRLKQLLILHCLDNFLGEPLHLCLQHQ